MLRENRLAGKSVLPRRGVAVSRVELLEQRRLFTSIVVSSVNDGPNVSVSLRAAVAEANTSTTPTTISFDPAVFATTKTILLGNGALEINNPSEPVTINGPGAGVVISGGGISGVFEIDAGSTVSINNLTVAGGTGVLNGGETEGGGIENFGTLTLNNNIITGNSAVLGGGLNSYGTATLNGDVFSSNTMTSQGGAISSRGGVLTVINSTLSGNTNNAPQADSDGGGIFAFGTVTLINDTIVSNASLEGGGVYTGAATIRNCTITDNAATYGGGLTFDEQTSGLTLGNTIIAENNAPNGPDFETIPRGQTIGSYSVGNNLIGELDGWSFGSDFLSSDLVGTVAQPVNPMLAALANNGGPTQTLLPLAASPAINGGSNALVPTDTATDQRGLPRISGSAVDIGAVEVQQPQTPVQLTGTPIGTPGSWDGTGTIYQVFDGNLNTFFDPANGNLSNWVGLDLGKNATITQIKYAPRAGYEYRMLNGQFQVSSTPDFSSNVQTIYTVTGIPTAGQLTTVNVNPGAGGTGYRYIRYTGGLQWVNIAEMQVIGLQTMLLPTPTPFTGTPIGAGGAYSPRSTYAAAFDANFNTFFDPANGNLSNWVGLDLGTPESVTQISFAPRAGYEFRMVGGQFQVSSTPDFSSNVQIVYTVTAAPVAGQLTTVSFEPTGAYRYVRFTGGTQWVNIAEFDVAGQVPPIPLSGTAIGLGGAWVPSSGYDAAFDGNLSTCFDPANGSLTNWVGLDLGSARTISQISYAARAGYEFRMVGAEIQVSNTADFSSDVQTIYTISAAPPAGQVVTVPVTPVTARYIRYIGGTQWVNIAELEVDGG